MTTAVATNVESASDLARFRDGISGIYEQIPADEYHKLRAVSSSVLKRLYCESPKHAKAVLDNPDLVGSDEITIGAAAHAALLTPEDFANTYVCAGQCEATVKASGNRCTNAATLQSGGEWLCGVHSKGLVNEAVGEILTLDVFTRVKGVHNAVWSNKNVRRLLLAATDRELSVLWYEEVDGADVLCKARYDLLCRGAGILPDLKTCRSAKPEAFTSDAWKRGYHLQLAHYRRGAIVSGIGADIPTIIAVENDEPYDVVPFKASDRFLSWGVEARDLALHEYVACEARGEWPGHSESYVELDVPDWVK